MRFPQVLSRAPRQTLGAPGPTAPAGGKGDRWALTAVVDHVTFAGSRMIAWYLAEPQAWSFRSVAEGEALILDNAARLAELVGTSVYLRVTARPYPVAHWARAHWANAPDPQEGFAAMVERDQVHMAAATQADKLVYYGVDLGERARVVVALGKVLAGAVDREQQLLQRRLEEVDRVMAGSGTAARPVTPKELEWLLARSFALGCPVPVPDPGEPVRSVLDASDLDEWVRTVSWDAEPLADSTRITTTVNDTAVTRHVVVLTLARLGDIRIPEEHEPWMAVPDALPFAVEWSVRIDPRFPEDVSREMTKIGNRVDAQVDHWVVDHGKRPPKQLARQAEHRAQVEDEQRAGFTHLSTRTNGWYRMAVSGRSEREALDRASQVIDRYRPHARWVRDKGQYAMAREFVPGEPLSSRAHCRHFPVVKVAAGLPAVTAEVGDRRGFHIGETAGLTARTVCFDPWYLPEVVETSGFVPIVGVQGSGKTLLMLLLCYKSALSGARGVVMDPAGRAQRMLALPELSSIARSVEVLGGVPGSLSPYAAVPEPSRALVWAECVDEDEYRERWLLARGAARQTRRDLALMTMRWSLPLELSRDKDVLLKLQNAVTNTPAEPGSTLWAPIEFLSSGDELGQLVARRLQDASERELGRLFFPSRRGRDIFADETSARLTVFSLRGLVRPADEVAMEDYTPEELLYRPIMSLAAWRSLQLIYRSDPHERKFFGLDEAQEVTEVSGAGRALIHKLRTDSRKNNNAVFAVSQHARVVADATNFVGAAFVGRTQSDDAQTAALRLLGKPPGRGYEQLLGQLSARARRDDSPLPYREFVYRDGLGGEDGRGGMEKIRVSIAHHPQLFAALNSTPTPTGRLVLQDKGPIPDDPVEPTPLSERGVPVGANGSGGAR